MSEPNRYGLSRHIPARIAREIRSRSKFGCVVCRSAIYQYEHIDPIFVDAHEHNPDYMCLLCGRCHDKVSRGRLSKATVKNYYTVVQASDKLKRPFDDFDLNRRELTITLGSSVFHGAKTLIELDGESVLAIEPPEEGASFPTLSGFFSDQNGTELLRIERNIWFGSETAWDIEVIGQTILIRLGSGDIALKLVIDPPSHIVVEKLDMRVGMAHLSLRDDLLRVGRLSTNEEIYLGLERIECYGAEVGVQVSKSRSEVPCFTGMNIVGGKGIDLIGTGVKVAVGSGKMTIRGLEIEHATRKQTVIRTYPLDGSLQETVQILPARIGT